MKTTTAATKIFTILQLMAQANAFSTPHHHQQHQTNTQLKATGPSSVEELLSTPSAWDPIKQELDHVPVFSCANDKGQPLEYNVGGKPIAFFFCDINAAKSELQKAQAETDVQGLNLLPFPLGEVFEMGGKEMAAIIPSAEALEAAGAPKGLNPVGQQVPLFGCMEIAATQPDGKVFTPLFFSYEEAEDAMNRALVEAQAVGGGAKFEITVMPLVKAVQSMAMGGKEKSFIFESPEASLEYLRSTM